MHEILKEYYDNGHIKRVINKVNGVIHNDDGPAIELFNKSGRLNRHEFYTNGKLTKLHNFSPRGMLIARRYYYDDSRRREYLNYLNNIIRIDYEKLMHYHGNVDYLFHREDGPAVIIFDNFNRIKEECYFIYNIQINDWCTENNISYNFSDWSEEDKTLFFLTHNIDIENITKHKLKNKGYKNILIS